MPSSQEEGLSYGLDEIASPNEAELDIVFVHGLFGNRNTTWTGKNGVLWPKVLLSEDLPTARIFNFGYDADVGVSKAHEEITQSTMKSHAADICNMLAGKRLETKTTDRPIIFIAHSLGGLVCAQILVMGDRNSSTDNMSMIAKYIQGMIFLGTPFHGSPLASWGEHLRRIIAVFTHTNKNLIRDLQDSDKLRDLAAAFAEVLGKREEQAENIRVAFFYETLPYMAFNVVEEESAWIPSRGDRAPIRANHIDICKYSTKEDEGYVKVLNAIKKILEMYHPAPEKNAGQGITARDVGILVGRDQTVQGDNVAGDKVGGDKFTGDKYIIYLRGPTEKGAAIVENYKPDKAKFGKQSHRLNQSPSRKFTGRVDILKRLEKFLLDPLPKDAQQQQRVFVLYGLGGSGKTQVCRKFVETHGDRFWGIFWIDATSDETANGDFSKIAGMNGLEGFEAGKQWIGSRKNNWLLIIDNADNPSNDIFNYFPPGPQGCILITSRNPDTRQYGTNHQGDSGYSELRGMDGEDGVTLLLKSAVPHQVNEEIRALAKPIVVELGGLALAIIQAGATIRQGGAKLEGYVDLYAKHHRELMEKHPGQGLDGYEHTVYTTWEISRKMIESSDSEFRSDAVDFLDISAFLHFDDVPQEILATAPTRSKPTFLDRVFDWGPSPPSKSAPRDSYRIHRALLLLSSFSLISFNEEGDGFSMHRLVHSWTRDRQKVRDRKWCQEAAQIVLADSIHCEREARKTTDYALRKRLAPHVGFLLENTSTCLTEGLLSVKQAQIASKFGLVFLENGKYDKAGTLYRQSVTDMKKALKRDHPDVLNGIHYQALALQSQGNSMGAMTLGKLAVEGREKVLGEDHPDTTESIANLALTLQALGNYDDAEKEGRKALERREKRLGIDDPDTIESVNNLSITLQSQGKLDKAEKMIWRAKEGYEKTLGPSHRDTLMSMSNLAVILRKRGDYPGAEKICLETLRRREEVLGRDHPDTLTSVANLVVILRRQGKLEAAKKLNERALSGYKEILGTHHPNTLASMGNQAQILLRQGKYYDAERMSRQTLAGYEQERGREHIDTILSTSQLASLLYTQKKYPEAFVLFKRACAGYEKRHAKDSAAEKCFQRFILLREEMKRLDIPEPSMMEEQQ